MGGALTSLSTVCNPVSESTFAMALHLCSLAGKQQSLRPSDQLLADSVKFGFRLQPKPQTHTQQTQTRTKLTSVPGSFQSYQCFPGALSQHLLVCLPRPIRTRACRKLRNPTDRHCLIEARLAKFAAVAESQRSQTSINAPPIYPFAERSVQHPAA